MKKITLAIFILSSVVFSSQIDMLLQACDAKQAAACEEIATLYLEGIGFEQNTTQAKKYYDIACQHGATHACLKSEMITVE
jgi:TPR repeat protein